MKPETTDGDAGPSQATPPTDVAGAPAYPNNLYDFRTGARLMPDPEDSDLRYSQRATDRLTTAFYEACKVGSMDTARKLREELEREVVRSCGLVGGDWREDGHDVVAVRERYDLEMARRARTAKSAPADPL